MSNPLYRTGQHVAVCKMVGEDGHYVSSGTTIVQVRGYYRKGQIFGRSARASLSGFYYDLADGARSHECWLRPINPDTEYLSDSAPQKMETPTQEEAGTTGSELGKERALP